MLKSRGRRSQSFNVRCAVCGPILLGPIVGWKTRALSMNVDTREKGPADSTEPQGPSNPPPDLLERETLAPSENPIRQGHPRSRPRFFLMASGMRRSCELHRPRCSCSSSSAHSRQMMMPSPVKQPQRTQYALMFEHAP